MISFISSRKANFIWAPFAHVSTATPEVLKALERNILKYYLPGDLLFEVLWRQGKERSQRQTNFQRETQPLGNKREGGFFGLRGR